MNLLTDSNINNEELCTILNNLISNWEYDSDKLYNIINNNRFNQNPKVYSCEACKTVDALTGSYIALVEEEAFLSNPTKYIDNAYDKSENDANGYDLTKTK